MAVSLNMEALMKWTPASLTNLALSLYDCAHIFGHFLEFEPWRHKFFPRAKRESAKLNWLRFKKRLRAAGVRFEEEDNEILFPSTSYVYAVVDCMIGPAIPEEPKGAPAPTMSVYDFFPGVDRAEVDDFVAGLSA